MTMRWYGSSDPVKLENIRQVPSVEGVVGAMFEIPVGEVWSLEAILGLQSRIKSAGLNLSVIESIPVHESIKLGTPDRDQYIEHYAQSIRNMASAGVYVLCYNFMPIFDWMRTDLYFPLPDGSTTMLYDQKVLDQMDLSHGLARLPAWANDFDAPAMNRLGEQYRELGEVGLLENFAYFLRAVIPVAAAFGVKMALHPDDPPWSLFGVPRIVRDTVSIQKILDVVNHPAHGLTFCTGSLGCNPKNNLPEMAAQFASRVNFVHARNVKTIAEKTFLEVQHPSYYGDVDMYAVLKTLMAGGFSGFIRSDHGRMIWGETGTPGYGLFDRALGATYLYGLIDAIQRGMKT